ncbi:hypothetical protein ACLBWS_15045 [Brucellaceae bacterium D45D]
MSHERSNFCAACFGLLDRVCAADVFCFCAAAGFGVVLDAVDLVVVAFDVATLTVPVFFAPGFAAFVACALAPGVFSFCAGVGTALAAAGLAAAGFAGFVLSVPALAVAGLIIPDFDTRGLDAMVLVASTLAEAAFDGATLVVVVFGFVILVVLVLDEVFPVVFSAMFSPRIAPSRLCGAQCPPISQARPPSSGAASMPRMWSSFMSCASLTLT